MTKYENSVFCEMFVALETSVLKKKFFFFQTWIFLKSRPLPFRKTWCEYKTGPCSSRMSFKRSVKFDLKLQLPGLRGVSNDARFVHFLVRPFELFVCYLFQNRELMNKTSLCDTLFTV